MKRSKEKGQALLLATVALAIFVIGAVGLVVDGAHIFASNQMAQSAADASAIAGIMSIFDGTNVTGPNPFGTLSAHTCTTTDPTTPCVIARSNGFGQTASDTVVYDFPANGSYPGISFAPGGDNLIRVTITRTLDTTLMRLLGTVNTTTAKAIAVAAIVDVMAPVPILVLHPTLSGSFSINGTPTITICGGPSRSIQVNSSSTTSISLSGGSNTVDLSHAGPNDPGNCSLGTGADFGDWGGPKNYPGALLLGSTGHYVQPASPINDPLAGISAPSAPGAPVSPPVTVTTLGTAKPWGCPALTTCTHYWPGLYPGGITIDHTVAYFEPGIYYITGGGFNLGSLSGAHMVPSTCSIGPPPDGCITPPTDFTINRGMMVYNSGNTKDDIFSFGSNAGSVGGITLVGSDNTITSNYKGILFFQDRTVTIAHNGIGANKAHAVQGGGNISLTGTIYATNTSTSNYQKVQVQGTAGSSTTITGQIVTDTLQMGGNAGITMNLNPNATLHIRQVALVQ